MDEKEIKKCKEELSQISGKFGFGKEADKRVTELRKKYGTKIFVVVCMEEIERLSQISEAEKYGEC